MWEKFAQSAKRIIKYAHEEAKHFRSDAVDTEHILLGLIHDRNSGAMKLLERLEADIESIQNATIKSIELEQFAVDALNFSVEAKQVLEIAFREARQLQKNSIGSEHLLLALLKVETGKAYRILNEFGITYEKAIKFVSISPPVRERKLPHALYGCDKVGWDDFTGTARRVIISAIQRAEEFRSPTIGTEHMLLGLVEWADFGAAEILTTLGGDVEKIWDTVTKSIEPGQEDVDKETLKFDETALDVLDAAVEESRRLGQETIGTEHLLLGLLKVQHGNVYRILSESGISYDKAIGLCDSSG